MKGVFLLLSLLAAVGASAQRSAPVDIHSAIVSGNMAAVKQYIVSRGDLNVRDPLGGSSPLITACVFGRTEMARALMDAGADINFRNNDGSTPLHTAAFFCRPEIVRLLLARSADRRITNKYGQTPAETVAAPFANMRPVYDGIGKMLEPMGLKLDYAYIEKTRPLIAGMLK
ncbi:MAG TPA: ankyrin repeat domain-containing protein [Puia sp.]|uniref:ankyrin repeat domain-containing protein n=1 Tax=Puia sp. TaxID=2045100 RepID=UPI002BA2FBD1|nr:ankyrin repeat domain-containing protein [Puia sp.]HVU94612.1 ankyrin repeat domain-containing protein [Puia sp.]